MRKLFLLAALMLNPDLSLALSPVVTTGELRPPITGNVSVTEGTLRMRRRHENDMDFSKYNPFYWQGRLGTYRIEDFTSKGENRINVTLTSEWPQRYIPTAGPDFSAVYTGDPVSPTEHLRSKFLFNMRMNRPDANNSRFFTATLDQGAFNAAGDAMKPGRILTMEFRFFLDESFPDWAKQKAVNPHNLSAYYTEFVRIKIGEPGVVIDHPFKAVGEASAMRYSGGHTTIPTARIEPWKALEQQAFNMRPEHAQAFLFGRTWTHTNFSTGEHVGEQSDDKPSVFFEGDRAYRAGFQGSAYNTQACVSCHENNASVLLPPTGQAIHTTILRTADSRNGATARHPSFGSQIQTAGGNAEGSVKITRWDLSTETLPGGETVELRRPVFEISSPLNKENLGFSPRRPLAWIGLGLLEAVPDETIRMIAKDNGGTISMDAGRIGRFGHKAERASIMDQAGSAMNIDLGVQTDISQSVDCTNGCKPGKGNLFAPTMNDIETYLRLLGVPPRLNPEDQNIQRGSLIFSQIGCAKCHVPSMHTGSSQFAELSYQAIQPFTDLLLHDMGEGLADSIPNTLQRKWRTTPLWGMAAKRASTDSRQSQFQPGNVSIIWTDVWKAVEGNKIEFLHDGRARTLEEAILWHGGEAQTQRDLYKKLSKPERDDLHKFLWDI